MISKEDGLGDGGIEFGGSKAVVNILLQKYQTLCSGWKAVMSDAATT